jgi:hypothetical protein
MLRWLGLLISLGAGLAAAMAFAAGAPRQAGPGLPCLPIGGCPTQTQTTTTTTPTTTTTTQTTPANTPPDPNAPQVGDGPAPHHPARHHNGVTVERLSDERTFTTWATYARAGRVTSRPFGRGRHIATLHPLTADRLPEVYLVLRSETRKGRTSLLVRVPVRPNGTTGWVERGALSGFHRVNTLIVVNRRALTLTLYRASRRVTSMRVGVGTPGNPTPAGRYWVNERFQVRSAPAYGPYAIGTTAFAPHLTDWPGGGVVGIHGTDEPGLIPGHVSHGCIRLHNSDIARLVRLVPLGTPIDIV